MNKKDRRYVLSRMNKEDNTKWLDWVVVLSTVAMLTIFVVSLTGLILLKGMSEFGLQWGCV